MNKLKMKSIYSTNTKNQNNIENYFSGLGYKIENLSKEPAAIGMGEEVVTFKIPGFDPRDLEGRLLKKWQELPIEVISC